MQNGCERQASFIFRTRCFQGGSGLRQECSNYWGETRFGTADWLDRQRGFEEAKQFARTEQGEISESMQPLLRVQG